jgi:hypothetical protein
MKPNPAGDFIKMTDLVDRLLVDDDNESYKAALEIARTDDEAIDCAVKWLTDSRPQLRKMACYILGEAGHLDPSDPLCFVRNPRGIVPLIAQFSTEADEVVRASAAGALGRHAHPSALPALLHGISDRSELVRYYVAVALGSYYWDCADHISAEKEGVGRALLHLMDDEDEDVRDWATFGIHQGNHDTPQIRKRLWKALDDPCPEVRSEAADGLAKFGDLSLVPRLERLLREDESISSLYFEAAEKLGDPSLLPAMKEAASSWSESLEEGERLPAGVSEAIKALEERAWDSSITTDSNAST